MSKENLESRLVFLEGFVVGVSSRIDALENRITELSNTIKCVKDCSEESNAVESVAEIKRGNGKKNIRRDKCLKKLTYLKT